MKLNPDYKNILNSIDSVILFSNVLFKINVLKKKKKAKNGTIFPRRPAGFSVSYQETVSTSFTQERVQWNRDLLWLGCLAVSFILLYMLHPSWDVVLEHVLGGCSCQALFQINRAQLHPIRETVQKIRYCFFWGWLDFCLHEAQRSLQRGNTVLGTFWLVANSWILCILFLFKA